MEQSRRITNRPVTGRKIFLKNNYGQFAIEAVLLTVVMVSIFALAVKFLRDRQYIQLLTNDSVGKVKNLSEYGTWKPVCKALKGSASQTAANCHPNSINRALSSDPQ